MAIAIMIGAILISHAIRPTTDLGGLIALGLAWAFINDCIYMVKR